MYGYPQEEKEENVLEKYGRDIVEAAKKGKLIQLLVEMMKLEVSQEFFQERQKIIQYL